MNKQTSKIMEQQFIEFAYNGVNIPFALTGSDVMINATEMIKLFPGKRINNFLRNDQTQELIKQIESETRISATQLVISLRGNTSKYDQGTWMHRKIAIAFAMWLSPAFYSWCLGKLDELINNGIALRDSEIQRLQYQISQMQPQVDYYKGVLTFSGLSYSTEDICKQLCLGCGPRVLLDRLEQLGYIYRRQSGAWHLSSGYDNCGYLTVTTKLVTSKKTGKQYTKPVKRWTEEGKHWIWSLRKKLGL